MARTRKGIRSLGAAADCAGCGRTFEFRDLSPAHSHPATVPLYVAAGVVTVAWDAFLLSQGVLTRPRGAAGVMALVALYAAPAVVLGGIARRLPRHRIAKCAECGWTGRIEMPRSADDPNN